MGGKSDPPPPPDFGPIAAAQERAAELSFELGSNQLDWAKEQYAQDSKITGRVVDSFLTSMDQNNRAAAADRARYEQVYQPLEDALIEDAASYSSPARRDLEIGRAQAAVAQQFEGARNAALQNLESFGIDPTSTRYAALDLGLRTQQAAAQAAAGNQASQASDAIGRALRSEAINVGRGYPGQIASQYGTALAAGSGGANTTLAQTASGANTMGTAPQYYGMGNQVLGNLGNQVANINSAYYKAWGDANSGGGWGSIAGALVGGAMRFLNDGGPVEGDPALPPPRAALPAPGGGTGGGPVPRQASPTGGRAIDDVDAKLTAGEFVLPKDVVQWVGQKGVHQMIEKARKERQTVPQQSGAIPATGVAPKGPPTFVSSPRAIG